MTRLADLPAHRRAEARAALGLPARQRPATARSGVRTTSDTPDAFPRLCAAVGLPAPLAEYRFAAPRRWRLDYAWPEYRVALEVEGGVWTQGRHTRPNGYLGDLAKYNALAVLGWRLLRCTPTTLATDATVALLRAALIR